MSTKPTPKEAAFVILFASNIHELFVFGTCRHSGVTIKDYADALGVEVVLAGLGQNWNDMYMKHADQNWKVLRDAARDWMINNVMVTRHEPSVDDGMVVAVNPPRMPS